jgi:hypothetical protein
MAAAPTKPSPEGGVRGTPAVRAPSVTRRSVPVPRLGHIAWSQPIYSKSIDEVSDLINSLLDHELSGVLPSRANKLDCRASVISETNKKEHVVRVNANFDAIVVRQHNNHRRPLIVGPQAKHQPCLPSSGPSICPRGPQRHTPGRCGVFPLHG